MISHAGPARLTAAVPCGYNTRMGRRSIVIRFPGPSREPSDEPDLTEVHRCDRGEALIVKGLLESEGIPALLRARIAHSVHPFSVGDQGEVVVLVPGHEAERSRRLLIRAV